MGLESVELLLAVEEHFEIAIPDELCGKLEKVGDMARVIVEVSEWRGRNVTHLEAMAFLRDEIVRSFRVAPSEVNEETRLIEDLRFG